MTRSRPTQLEATTFAALIKLLEREGQQFSRIDRLTEDNPDFLFVAAGKRIACEATQIPDHGIMYPFFRGGAKSASTFNMIEGETHIWPIEPHMWAMRAISKKNKLVAKYRLETSAEQVWLVLHPPAKFSDLFFSHRLEWLHTLLRAGANMSPHSFQRIFFYFPKTEKLTSIYPNSLTYVPTTNVRMVIHVARFRHFRFRSVSLPIALKLGKTIGATFGLF